MENTDVRARVAEVAAPVGGWPKLSAELVEVRFFLQQGALDEAYEMLSILQRRFPGHPELADFARTGGNVYEADAQVEALVDGVLADSSTLGGQVLRRRSVKWGAPAAPGAPKKWTTAHQVVRAAIPEVEQDLLEEVPSAPPPVTRKPRVRHPTKAPKKRTKSAAVATAGTRSAGPPKPKPRTKTRTKTKSKRTKTADGVTLAKPGPKQSARPRNTAPMASGPKKPAPPKSTRVYRAVTPKPPPRPGMTMAVDALSEPTPFGASDKSRARMTMAVASLQQPTPFGDADPPSQATAEPSSTSKKKGKGKRGRKLATKTSRKRKLEAREKKAPRTVAFGAGVLSRYGR